MVCGCGRRENCCIEGREDTDLSTGACRYGPIKSNAEASCFYDKDWGGIARGGDMLYCGWNSDGGGRERRLALCVKSRERNRSDNGTIALCGGLVHGASRHGGGGTGDDSKGT